MAAGAITVPAYTTNTVDDHRHILTDSGAELAIVSTAALAERAAAGRGAEPAVPRRRHHGAGRAAPDGRRGHRLGRRSNGSAPTAPTRSTPGASRSARATTLACLIYTSGTGGAAQGRHAVAPRHPVATARAPIDLLDSSASDDRGASCRSCRCRIPTSTRGPVLPDLDRRGDLLRRGRRHPGRQHARGAADDHDRGAAPLRGHAPAHPAAASNAGEPSKQKLFDRAVRARPQALRRPAPPRPRRAAPRPAARPAGARQGAGSASAAGSRRWSPAARRSTRSRRVLHRARRAPAAGLRPDRGGAGGQLQPARPRSRCDTVGPPLHGRRGQDRRRRRDPGARRAGHAGLLEQPGGDRRRRCGTAGCTPATSACSTTTATSGSPTARRTSSSIPAATTSSPQRVEGILTLEPEIAQAMVYGDKRPLSGRRSSCPTTASSPRYAREHGVARRPRVTFS